MKQELNGYDMSRNFFDWCYENPDKINPTHIALYFFIIEHCNRLGWKDKFGLPTQMAMDAIGVKNWRTYKKAFDDLVEFGFIEVVQKSKNQYSANVIAIVKNTKANTKAYTKALQKHIQKHSSSTAHIFKPNNNITIEQEREREKGIISPEVQKIISMNTEKEIKPVFKEISTDTRWLEVIAMNYKLKSVDRALDYLEKFMNKLRCEGTEYKSINDTKSHFSRWLNIELNHAK